MGADHDFEWFDLDAVQDILPSKNNDECKDTVLLAGHDFNAGLLFTTAEQILDRETETNTRDVIASPLRLSASSSSSSSSSSSDADDNTSTLTNSTSSDRISSNSNSGTPNRQQQQPTFEFDFGVFFRTSSINKNESNEDRFFREQMEELEHEIRNEASTATVVTSSITTSTTSMTTKLPAEEDQTSVLLRLVVS